MMYLLAVLALAGYIYIAERVPLELPKTRSARELAKDTAWMNERTFRHDGKTPQADDTGEARPTRDIVPHLENDGLE